MKYLMKVALRMTRPSMVTATRTRILSTNVNVERRRQCPTRMTRPDQAHDVHHRLPNLDDNGDDKVGPGEADKLDDDDCVVLQNEKECEE